MRLLPSLLAGVLGLALMFPAQAALQDNEEIQLLAPGDALPPSAETNPPAADWLTRMRWYAFRLVDGRLFIDPVRNIRPPDWLQLTGTDETDETTQPLAHYSPVGVAPDLPPDSLFALRILRDGQPRPLRLNRQGYPSLLTVAAPMIDYQGKFLLNGKDWTLRIHPGPDDAPHQTIVALNAEAPLTLAPRGNAPGRLLLLWLGDFDQDGEPDAVLQRQWEDGEQEYILLVGHSHFILRQDMDRPVSVFSSGVEDSVTVTRHVRQTLPWPDASFTGPAFDVSPEAWPQDRHRLSVPVVVATHELEYGKEKLAFRVEQRAHDEEAGVAFSSSAGSWNGWNGDMWLTVNYRGHSQVLMHGAAAPAEDGLNVTLVKIAGQPGIRVSYMPHYNNGFTFYWVYSEEERRFKRLLIRQDQGC